MIGRSLASGVRGIGRFRGRDGRAMFWFYAGTVMATVWVLGSAALFALMLPVFRLVASVLPREGDPGAIGPQLAAPGLPIDMAPFVAGVTTIAALSVLLLAAAIVRRLHDSGRSGAWALPSAALLAAGLAIFVTGFGDGQPDPAVFLLGLLVNLLYLGSLALLAVLLLLPGTPGPNRYGPPPPPA